MSRLEIIALIKAITKAISELDEWQYQQLLDGKGRVKFIELEPQEKPRSKKAGKSRKVKLTDREIESIASKLRECQTREAALRLLHKDSEEIPKESLVSLAKLLGVHVNKNDRSNVIEDKIVEFVVGVRLRSEAIRGLQFKS